MKLLTVPPDTLRSPTTNPVTDSLNVTVYSTVLSASVTIPDWSSLSVMVGEVASNVISVPATVAVLPAVSVIANDDVIVPSSNVDRSTVPVPLSVNAAVTVVEPSVKVTTTVASESTLATV